MDHSNDAWPVFWCSLLGPLFLGEIPEGERKRYLRELSQQEHLLPNGKRKRISLRTLRRQFKRYQSGSVRALYRRGRSDRGKSRWGRAALLARAVELKKEQPLRSDEAINRMLQAELGRQVPRSTLYRHLKQAGATRLRLGASARKIRCRWTREQSNALWVGDFEHGPHVIHNSRSVRTHLSIWIDCHSRYVVEGRYYVRENFDVLIDSLLRAWTRHGASREIYVDNAKIYHANALKLACAQLNIKLLHRPPKDPPAGGLVERVIQTAQTQFEAEVEATKILTLDQLNRYFFAWLECAYHQRCHSETKEPPAERYQAATRFTRQVNHQDILGFFHRTEKRKVHGDFSDVQLENRFFAVDPKLRGERVLVKYDPFSSLEEVVLYSLQGQYLGVGRRHEREKGSQPQPPAAEPRQPIEPRYLELLEKEHRQAQQERAQQGIDYHSARRRSVWPLSGFAAKFARLLGRKGGVSALDAQEMEILTKFHQDHQDITEGLLLQAFEQAEPPTIPVIVFHLQTLLNERKS